MHQRGPLPPPCRRVGALVDVGACLGHQDAGEAEEEVHVIGAAQAPLKGVGEAAQQAARLPAHRPGMARVHPSTEEGKPQQHGGVLRAGRRDRNRRPRRRRQRGGRRAEPPAEAAQHVSDGHGSVGAGHLACRSREFSQLVESCLLAAILCGASDAVGGRVGVGHGHGARLKPVLNEDVPCAGDRAAVGLVVHSSSVSLVGLVVVVVVALLRVRVLLCAHPRHLLSQLGQLRRPAVEAAATAQRLQKAEDDVTRAGSVDESLQPKDQDGGQQLLAAIRAGQREGGVAFGERPLRPRGAQQAVGGVGAAGKHEVLHLRPCDGAMVLRITGCRDHRQIGLDGALQVTVLKLLSTNLHVQPQRIEKRNEIWVLWRCGHWWCILRIGQALHDDVSHFLVHDGHARFGVHCS